MKRRVLLVTFFITLWVQPLMAAVIFYDDAENFPNTSEDWLIAGNDGQNSFEVSNEKARSGKNSYKFTLAPYGTPKTETNVELVLRGLYAIPQVRNFLFGQEYWMGWSIYIPNGFVFPDNRKNDWGLIGQFHGATDMCDKGMGPPFALFLKSETEEINVRIAATDKQCSDGSRSRATGYITPSLRKGAWNDIVLNFRFNYQDKGNPFIKVWLNGKLVADDVGANCFNDQKPPYFKMGIYANSSSESTVYYDEIRVGDETSSYDEVAPKGSGIKNEDTGLSPPQLRLIPSN